MIIEYFEINAYKPNGVRNGCLLYLGVLILAITFPLVFGVLLIVLLVDFIYSKIRISKIMGEVREKNDMIAQEEKKQLIKVRRQKSVQEKEDLVQKMKERHSRERKEEANHSRQMFFDRNSDLVEKFLEITERKVSVIDDYGDENWKILSNEILTCLKKVSDREGHKIDWNEYSKAFQRGERYLIPINYALMKTKLKRDFIKYHKEQKLKPSKDIQIDDLSGVEFETYIAKVLQENGFEDVKGTPTTGDQGADLIAKKGDRIIIIQAKRWNGTVGNKSVQEVVGAVHFYGGTEGWVITNSRFTSSAKALAHKSGTKLIDGSDLKHIERVFS
jgi:HJR/Mrr/RecB family endonuclease